MGILEERTKTKIKELQQQCTIKKWKLEEIKEIVNVILETESVTVRQATPIVRIAKHYGFGVYNEKMKARISSAIKLNGNTIDIYGKEKVIVVNEDEELGWKRYFVAVALGEYILNFLGNENYQSTSSYSYQYYRYRYKSYYGAIESERFAIEILMPVYSFLRQYLIATNVLETSIFRTRYLSRFFELPEELIMTRIGTICCEYTPKFF